MAWVIDKDHFADQTKRQGTNANAVGMCGPRGYKGNGSELPHRFRMLTDDRELVYEGRSDDPGSFGPLDNFGRPNFGCTVLEYWDSQRKEWVEL